MSAGLELWRHAVLAFDIGNSLVKAAILREEGIERIALPVPEAQIGRLAGLCPVIATVRPAPRPPEVDAAIAATGLTPLEIGRDLPILQPSRYATPQTLGQDRLLAARGARESGVLPVLILTAGTAWTIDLVDADGVFGGGAIAPGLRALAQGLKALAPRLPVTPWAGRGPDPAWPALDSHSCLELGQRFAAAGQLAAALGAARQAMPSLARIILSGGDADLLLDLWPPDVPRPEVDRDLLFRGIAGTIRDASGG